MKKIKIVQIGCGKMSKYIMRYIYENGCEISGAFDINKDVIGKDIGTIMELDNKGVYVEDISLLDEKLKEINPDVAIVTTMSLISDLHEVLRTCAKNGVNAITTCEEAFFASNSNPKIYKELDVLAKANNCTITGSGYQDIYWGQLISSIAGSTQKITKIKGSSSYNVEDYGIALANVHGAGLTLDDFEKNIASVDKISESDREKLIEDGKFLPSYMWNVVGWLADKLNLHITSMNQECVPQTYDKDLHSTTLNMDIKAGNATGMSAVVTAKTEEGIEIEAECIGKVYAPDEFDKNEWTVYGEPDTTIVVNRPATVELTCADVVNRIPALINSEAGFVPTSKMGQPMYPVKKLSEYIKE